MNMSRSWIAPLAIFLTETLGAMSSQLKLAIQSSTELQDKIANLLIPSSFELVTFDIKNLYPSIDQVHFMESLGRGSASSLSRNQC